MLQALYPDFLEQQCFLFVSITFAEGTLGEEQSKYTAIKEYSLGKHSQIDVR